MEPRRTKALALIAVLFLSAAYVPVAAEGGAGPDRDAAVVLEAVVDNWRGGPFVGTYTFAVERPGRVTEYVMQIVTDGDERSLIRVIAPPREAGQAFLMNGSELWMYNARLGRSLRLPPSGRSGAFLGSDVSYSDLAGRDFETDYTVAFSSTDTTAAEDPATTVVLELIPKPGAPTPYGRVLIGVDATSLTPRWIDYYDQRDQVVKHLALSDYLETGDRRLPRQMVVDDRTRGGYRTVIRLADVQLDAPVPDACFTIQALERGCL